MVLLFRGAYMQLTNKKKVYKNISFHPGIKLCGFEILDTTHVKSKLVHSVETKVPKWLFSIAPKWGRGEARMWGCPA